LSLPCVSRQPLPHDVVDTTGWLKILDERHYHKAAQIIRGSGHKEGIRTLDSLQLVAAFEVYNAKFLSADKFLSDFVSKMGFKVERI